MNRSEAYIADAKLNYLLHDDSKSGLFALLGYDDHNIGDLRRGLLIIVRTQPLAERIATEHGTKYIILGYIDTPSYGLFHLRTVWFIRHGETALRFVTAVPQRS